MKDAQKAAQKRYDKKNRRKFTINLNYNTDADLIAMLETRENVQGFIKQVLTERMYSESVNDFLKDAYKNN